MSETAITAKPRMVVEPSTDPTVERRIKMIDRSIHESPEQFQVEMSKLGELAIEPIALSEVDKRVVRATRQASALIEEYLGNRYDLDSSFDRATETALQQDEHYSTLLQASRGARNVLVKTGAMKSEIRANTSAVSARDEFRGYRLGAYIQRVIDFQAQHGSTEQSNLSDAI